MSVSIQFVETSGESDGPFQLATAQGWAAFKRWAAPSSQLSQLAASGLFVGTDELSAALNRLLSSKPPLDANKTTASLQEVLGVGDPNETAMVISEESD